MSKLTALCETLKISADVKYSDKPVPENFAPGSVAYRVTLKLRAHSGQTCGPLAGHPARRLTVDFYCGPACNEPTAADVLACLVSDVTFGEESFEDFCSELGYDPDSRKAEKTWKACKRMAPKVRRFCGGDLTVIQNAEH